MKIRAWLRDPKGQWCAYKRRRDNKIAMEYQRGLRTHWIDSVSEFHMDDL